MFALATFYPQKMLNGPLQHFIAPGQHAFKRLQVTMPNSASF